MKKANVRFLCESAVIIALSTDLSLIQVMKMPLGGSVTPVSMLPVMLIAVKYGFRRGTAATFVYSVIQLFISLGEIMSWGLTPTILISSIVFDYILAYTLLSLAGIFGKKETNVYAGVATAVFTRFLCHLVSGVVFFMNGLITFGSWDNGIWSAIVYSFLYNGSYMLAELVLTLIVTVLIMRVKPVRRLVIGE